VREGVGEGVGESVAVGAAVGAVVGVNVTVAVCVTVYVAKEGALVELAGVVADTCVSTFGGSEVGDPAV